MILSKTFFPTIEELTILIQIFRLKKYWEARLRKFGKRSVLNYGYSDSEIVKVTERHKELTFPVLKNHLQGWEKTILDLGCGHGRFTPDLANMLSGKALGFDLSEELVRLAPQDPRVDYQSADSTNLPLEDSSIDVVWIFQMLGGLRGIILRKTVQEIRRVLKNNGLLFLVENTTNKPSARTWSFRPGHVYRQLFPFVDLRQELTFPDLGERVSILAGRKQE